MRPDKNQDGMKFGFGLTSNTTAKTGQTIADALVFGSFIVRLYLDIYERGIGAWPFSPGVEIFRNCSGMGVSKRWAWPVTGWVKART